MSTRHTFKAKLPDDARPGDEIMVELFVYGDARFEFRDPVFALREKPWHSWGPPCDLTQTS